MPAFDPVRDAIRTSSPVATFQSPFLSDQPLSSPLDSPTLARRATDLSVLLNTESGQPSSSPKPSSVKTLTHLLHEDKLNSLQPLRRSTLDIDSDLEETAPRSKRTSPSTSLVESPSATSRPSSSSSSSNKPFSTPRTTVSPVMHTHPLPSTIPYNPTRRKTPASSVLIPLSFAEMQMYKSFRGKGTARLTKRKRPPSSERDDQRPTKKLAGDVGVVVSHYNSRPEVGVVQRLESPIIGLKNFNNWVKSVLISKFAQPALAKGVHGRGRGRGKVLDMGCGKGGDVTKWAKSRVAELIGADIADVSVDQARQRWESLRGPKFDAYFAALDCYNEPLTKVVPKEKLIKPFDVVSMQFCMHYAFETEAKTRCMLQNVSQWLRPGGVFIGTIPNADQLLEQLDALSPDASELSFGNTVYQIRFENREPRPTYGHRYWFFLQDAVENVPEYLVHWDNFVQLAAQYSLYPTYKEEFHQVFAENQEDPEFGPLMVKMKVVDANGESAMDEDQWEAANIYIAFAFEKQ